MNRTRWMTSLALLAVLAIGAVAFAQGPNGRRGSRSGSDRGFGGPDGRGQFGFVTRDLDLSDAQRQQIRAIVTKAREDNRPILERVRQAEDERRKAMSTMPVDDNQIRSTTQALVSAETDLAIARAHVQSDMIALLTPEQQAKVAQARDRRQTRLEERRSRQEQRSRPN